MPETRLQQLRLWRKVVLDVARIVGELYPEAEVYLVGGAAEGRLTVLSDIDIAVVFSYELGVEERTRILARLWEELESYGIPPYYPLHIMVLSKSEFQRLLGRKKPIYPPQSPTS